VSHFATDGFALLRGEYINKRPRSQAGNGDGEAASKPVLSSRTERVAEKVDDAVQAPAEEGEAEEQEQRGRGEGRGGRRGKRGGGGGGGNGGGGGKRGRRKGGKGKRAEAESV
jgi:uncharacterized membrane protein YgcG